MKQQLIALALSTALLAGSAAAIAPEEAFPAVNTYPGFADVAGSAWYAATVQTCYEVGLMTGTGAGFAPDQVLTVGEVAAIAARMNEAITGDSIYLVDSTLPWYASYVDYLEKLGVEVPDPVKQATRQEFIAMLAAVVPEDMLTPINQITALPDTADAAVLSFYNAGILTGVDDWGTFAPDKTLTRAETAAMVARVARPELRESFTPADYAMFTAAYLNQINLNLTQNTGQAQQSFRMSKHDLRARPVFHHTHDAIEAHLTVVMAALAVARYLQDVTGISIKRIIRTLKPLQDVTINLNGHNITAQPQITPTAASILKSLQSPGH